MGAFDSFNKKTEKIIINNEKIKTKSPFQMVTAIFTIIDKISKDEISEVFIDLIEDFSDIKDRTFVANLLLKYSVYNKKCLGKNNDLVKVFVNMSPDIFIMYFISFCIENSIHFPPFLKYYNLGLMASSTKYTKCFLDNDIEESDLEIIKAYLKNKVLSLKDLFILLKQNKIKISELNDLKIEE